ncbi:MAG TPA: DUF1206 domain-containing protein [Polyangiales bacterium]|nr:DUF1206 domain-containing protein [Polyangiales bacterium]
MAIPVPRHVVAHSSRGVVVAARIGYAAEAVVYSVLGTLAVMAAFGIAGGKLTDNKGALKALGDQPFGSALLWASALGMLCYALWNGVRAALDPEHKGSSGGALFARAGYAFSAGAHVLLAVYASQLAYGSSPSSGGTQTFVGKVLRYPFGAWLVAAFGLIAIGFGIAQVVKGVKGKVGQEYQRANLAPGWCRGVQRFARVGVSARGVVFALIGTSLVTAALKRDSSHAEGFAQALGQLANTPLGVGLLLFVAGGLLAYGIHLFFMARWGAFPEPR